MKMISLKQTLFLEQRYARVIYNHQTNDSFVYLRINDDKYYMLYNSSEEQNRSLQFHVQKAETPIVYSIF